ncbi:MAG: phospho-N-acetylmuramoyl-pentapeptide-transferase [Actinobacteria bacterium]|nr:phospho-N-acetylmuramoyl-pentapeptide-transferase [Actinomycetota bacterium]
MISILIAGAVAMFFSLAGTRFLMSYFRRLGKGQPILGAEDHGPVHQMGKQGTPTMGGIAILVSGVVGWTFLDDFLKVRRQHNRGIFWKKKGWITFGITIGLTLILAASTGVVETISFTRAMSPGWDISGPIFVVWTALMVWSTTNAVNVTDGLDGLAAGSALFGFLAFTVIAYWAFRNPRIYDVVNPLDLAVLSAAMAGACAGFLWWNAAPARIFMGDVGALGLGAALGMLAVTTNTHLMLPIICGINVIEAGSVAIQMGVFKASGRKKRLFKMSPIHHHFELSGWPETTVIIRFWIISGICVATAVAIFIADFTQQARIR